MDSQVFAISHTENMILVRIDAMDAAYSAYIKSYINKNFKFFIHLKESILIFPKNEDRGKRKFFLGCLLNNLNKTKEIKQYFDFNLDVPFFVEFANSKESSQASKVIVKCHRDKVFFRFSEDTKKIVDFLKRSFFCNTVDVDYVQKVAKVKVENRYEYTVLRKLLARKLNLDGTTQVKFTYNEEELIRLNSYTKSSFKRFEAYSFADITPHLKELNCTHTDTLDTIKSRYLELVKRYHPDRVYGKDEETVKEYTSKFRRVQTAFEEIKKHKLEAAS